MKNWLAQIIARLNKNKFFKFISSVRLAVPVMVGIGATVAAGTIFESLYNAEYARAAVYNTSWFTVLMSLLALNIFASMMSRFPWKIHHVGFVTTHIGILVLLLGGTITTLYGVDGSLQIPLNEPNNRIVLPAFMVAYQYDDSPTLNSIKFERGLFEKTGSSLNFINDVIGHVVRVEKYMPFAEVAKGYSGGGDPNGPVAVSFGMKSQFFSVQEWLHSTENPVLQMGPATLRLVLDEEIKPETKLPKKKAPPKNPKSTSESFILVKEISSGKELARLSLSKLKSTPEVNGIQFRIEQIFKRAIVASNKIVENEDPAAVSNPAIALTLSRGNEQKREILFAKFPGFTMSKGDLFGLALTYENSGTQPEEMPEATDSQPAMGGGGTGNVIEFHALRGVTDKVRIELRKGGEKVAEQWVKEGETYQTPWMGIQVYVASINFGSNAVSEARSVEPKSGSKQLPSSAIQVRLPQSTEPVWLGLGEVKRFENNGRGLNVIFANQQVTLPFQITLKEFTKRDYPGTETPYSYESRVIYNGDGSEHLISMNEPLKAQGYTLYQASYILNPGQPPISILSVNKDPGRPVKYAGSIILSFGVIIFTLMRSRVYRNMKKETA